MVAMKDSTENNSSPTSHLSSHKSRATEPPKSDSVIIAMPRPMDTESELAKLEQEFVEVNRDYSTEEIGGWEFDELEQELRSEGSKRTSNSTSSILERLQFKVLQEEGFV